MLPPDADSFISEGMDFTKYLIEWWETTFHLWCWGESMSGDNINKGDLLIVDKLPEVLDDSICVYI